MDTDNKQQIATKTQSGFKRPDSMTSGIQKKPTIEWTKAVFTDGTKTLVVGFPEKHL